MTEKANVITYNGESLSEYLRKLEKFKIDMNKKKYNLLLSFVNDLLELKGKFKLNSLTKFKFIREVDIIADLKRNKKIIQKYKDQFKNSFGMDFDEKFDKKLNKNPMNFIYNLRKVLKSINYKLTSKKMSGERKYFINYVVNDRKPVTPRFIPRIPNYGKSNYRK